ASRTRWFPVSYLPHVKQLVREYNMASPNVLDAAHAAVQAELQRRILVKSAVNGDGVVNSQVADDYAKLGLHPSAPRWLIEWAIIGWRKDLGSLGAPTTRLLELEECYRRICAGPSAYQGET